MKRFGLLTLLSLAVGGPVTTALAAQPLLNQLQPANGCIRTQLALRVLLTRRSYHSGRAVEMAIHLRNGGVRSCGLAVGSCLPQVVITSAAGVVVWNRAATQVSCSASLGYRLAAGATLMRSVRWSGRVCAGREPRSCPGWVAKTGRYRVRVTWSPARSVTATFVITR